MNVLERYCRDYQRADIAYRRRSMQRHQRTSWRIRLLLIGIALGWLMAIAARHV